MSKRFKELREKSGVKKTELAEMLNVDYRTITNWEKERGTYPSLDVATDVAKALGISTYEVFKAFLIDSNDDNQDDCTVYDNFERLEHPADGDMLPKDFFRYLFKDSAGETELGSGVVQYGSDVFRFTIAAPIPREYEGETIKVGEPIKKDKFTLQPVKFSDKEKAKEWFEYPYGFFVADTKMNLIVFSEENVERCRFVSNNCGNLIFELVLTSPVFLAMEDEIKSKHRSSVRLTFFDYRRNEIISRYPATEWIEQIRFDFDKDNIIGRFIKSVRTRYSLSQAEFASGIVTPTEGKYSCAEISNKTINKWETGVARPSLLQLFLLGESYDFSIQRLLDQVDAGFFVENAVDNLDGVYDVGLNYWFARSVCVDSWMTFVTQFKLAKRFIENLVGNCAVFGEVDNGKDKKEVSDITFSKTEIVILSKGVTIIAIPIADITTLTAKNCLGNLLYETEISFGKKIPHKIKIEISFFAQTNSKK